MLQRETLLYECDTALDHYQVVDMTYEGRPARVLFSGDRSAAFSGMPLDDNHDMLFDYIQRLFELVSTVRPKRLLMIGGGTYTLPMALVRSLPDIIVDALEIDPKLDDIAEAFFGLTPHERLNIHHVDGKTFLEQTENVYDLIIIDAFTGLHIPRSLADERTVQLIHQTLSADGIFAMNIISGYKGVNALPVEHFYNLYAPQFATVNVFPADSAVSLWSPQNLVLIAQKQPGDQTLGLRFGAFNQPIQTNIE